LFDGRRIGEKEVEEVEKVEEEVLRKREERILCGRLFERENNFYFILFFFFLLDVRHIEKKQRQ